MIKLRRAQIGRSAGLDVTVKSAQGEARLMAPTWDMVMGNKKGVISNADYTKLYHTILLRNEQRIVDYLKTREEWTFLCYCRDGWFCHTYLLIDWLVDRHGDVFCK